MHEPQVSHRTPVVPARASLSATRTEWRAHGPAVSGTISGQRVPRTS